MNTNRRKWLLGMSVLVMAIALQQESGAQCGLPQKSVKPATFTLRGGNARLRFAAYEKDRDDDEHKPSIVGMWHTLFIARTSNGNPIPDTVIDNSLVVWHADQTEIMNSGRPPQDGNFCLGVWEQTGRYEYKLNHFAWAANNYTPGTAEGIVGTPAGPVHYTENVTVAPDGKRYTGTFTLKAYDPSGSLLQVFTGVLKATRITVDTTTADLL